MRAAAGGARPDPQAVALIEVGASAGLCLGVDRYAYRFDDDPVIGEGRRCWNAARPGRRCAGRLPDIVWRRGIDLAPLSIDPGAPTTSTGSRPCCRPTARTGRPAPRRVRHPRGRPARGGGRRRGRRTARGRGDRTVRPTLVIVALGTLVYLPPADREAVLGLAAELGARLVTMEPATALPAVAARLAALTAPHPTPSCWRSTRNRSRTCPRTVTGCLG